VENFQRFEEASSVTYVKDGTINATFYKKCINLKIVKWDCRAKISETELRERWSEWTGYCLQQEQQQQQQSSSVVFLM
jgi:hypothetical protein